MRTLIVLLLSVMFCAAQQPEPERLIRVSWEVAQGHVISHPPGQCPPIAKAARLSGVVLIEIQVDREGKVRSRKVKSGHPMLTQAALDNIQQWSFRPTLLNGEPIVMETTAEIAVCGVPDASYEKENKLRAEQMAAEHECRARMDDREIEKAEKPCRKALELAKKVVGNTYIYEGISLVNLGRLRLLQQNPREALPLFEEALRVREANQKPDEAEVGSAVAWVGIAKRRLGDEAGALPDLERAEKIFTARIAGTEFEEMRRNYARELKIVREQHASALRNLGRTDEADAMRKLASE